jgi:hypothetical protein
LIKKLLKRKNKDEMKEENRLIKNMVKEDEYSVEMKSRRITELEYVKKKVRLISEMIDKYKMGKK